MQKKIILALLFLAPLCQSFAQERPVEIEEKRESNRLHLYAVNKNLIDLDVAIEVEGTGFKKRQGVPRKYRVPAASKVNIMSLIVERGRVPVYTYKLDVSDSLSRRVIIKESEAIKVDPKKAITLFFPKECTVKCDSIVAPLDRSPFIYRKVNIEEDANVKSQISKSLIGGEQRLDTLSTPIVMLGGKMYLNIASYDELIEKLNAAEE